MADVNSDVGKNNTQILVWLEVVAIFSTKWHLKFYSVDSPEKKNIP